MRLSGYTFAIDDGTTVTPVQPVTGSLKFKDEPDATFRFVRRSLTTPLVFTGADYALLKAYEEAGCDPVDLVVEYEAAEVYRGVVRFGTGRVVVDLTGCRIEVQLDPQDDYTCLVNSWGEERNIFIGTVRKSIRTLLGTLYQETCNVTEATLQDALDNGAPAGCLTSDVAGFSLLNWQIAFDPLGPPPGDQVISTAVWVQERLTWPCDDDDDPVPPPGGGWALVSDDCIADGTATWSRPVGLTFIGIFTSPLPYLEAYEVAGGATGQFRNGVTLKSLLLLWAGCGLTVVSDFLNINPDGTAPANDAYTDATANLGDVLVFQKSDIRLPRAAAQASVGMWTLQGLLGALQVQFDVLPRVVGGALRLEHRTYWAAGAGLDLTAGDAARIVARSLRYTYDDTILARQERWTYMEEASVAFTGTPIRYTSCLPEGVREEQPYPIDRVNNDVAFIQSNPDRVADDGFVFVAAYVDGVGDYFILSEPVIAGDGGVALNGHLSIPNLLDAYHRGYRLLPTGILNGAAVTFDSARPRRVQDQFTVILPRAAYHGGFDAAQTIETVLGLGEAKAAEWEAADGSLVLDLAYP